MAVKNINGQPTQCVDEFCYLGSLLTNTSSCDKEIRTRIGKANSAFKRLDCIWRQKTLGLPIKIRLYESIVLAILLHCAETWAITDANRKRLEAFHHNCLRKLLNLLEATVRKRRLRWFGHVKRMEDSRTAKQALNWFPDEKRKRGRLHVTWRDTFWRDIECMDMTWEDVCLKATDREEWKQWTARCASH